MRSLNHIELEFVTKCPNILEEEVVRPVSKKVKTIAQKLNDEFADVVSEMNSYSVKNDEVIRDLHKTAYEWAKDEKPEIINELVAFVVKKDDCEEIKIEMALSELSEHLLAAWEQPVEYRFIEEFPRTTIGKVDYRKLEDIVNNI